MSNRIKARVIKDLHYSLYLKILLFKLRSSKGSACNFERIVKYTHNRTRIRTNTCTAINGNISPDSKDILFTFKLNLQFLSTAPSTPPPKQPTKPGKLTVESELQK